MVILLNDTCLKVLIRAEIQLHPLKHVTHLPRVISKPVRHVKVVLDDTTNNETSNFNPLILMS